MTSRRSMLLGLVLGAFLSALSLNVAYAQVPRSISYQGLLVKNNAAVNAQVNLHITIYDAAGVKLYEESANQVQVTNGLFNVLLGGNSGVLPASLKFDEQYFLGIDVDGTGEVTPRTPFVAAPYALNSQTVGGVGVSVTPQPGMLLPLDANGKVPLAALPQAGSAPITSIDGAVLPDGLGDIKLHGANGITIADNSNLGSPAPGHITIGFSGAAAGINTVVAGAGLTGGGGPPNTSVTLSIAPNGITPSMLGTGSVTGAKLDQNIPQWGLYQDVLGQLNVGLDATLLFTTPTRNGAPGRSVPTFDGIGLNLANPNTWTGTQTFSAIPTGLIVTTNAIFNGNVTLNPGVLTINGTAEPLAAPNAATYEIVDNGDLKVTGSSYLVGNTYIGAATNNGTNTIGTAGASGSANTMTGITNAVTGTTSNTLTAPTNTLTATTSNNIQGPANNIGTTNSGSVNTIGNPGSSSNTVTGTTNTVTATGANTMTAGTTNTFTATTSNNMQAPANNIGTTNASSTNIIGNVATSNNTVTGLNNTITGAGTNSIQAPINNIGTTQIGGNTNTIGTLGVSANTINGLTNSFQATTTSIGTGVANAVINIGNTGNNTTTNIAGLVANVNANTNNIGTQSAPVTNNIGTGVGSNSLNNIGVATSINTINGTTTFNGTHIVNGNSTFAGNITQTLPGTTATFLTTNTGNLTVTGTITQSGGNATINGGATNVFGSVAGSNNTIGAAGSTNTITGATNNMTATTQNNINGTTVVNGGTTVNGNTQINGTLGSTGNINLGTVSTNNVIGAPGAINTFTGATNNLNATTANNVTGDLIQLSGRAALAPSPGTTNTFGTAINQTNNISTGNGTTTTIGNGSGNVNNIGTAVAGTSTNNIGNLNPGTTNNLNGLTTVQFTGNQTFLRVAGGAASCVGVFPLANESELLVNGDGFFDGTLAACRLNIFGAGGSCIANLNTTNFGSCGGPGVAINLISSLNGVPTGVGATDITNIQNIQASNNIKANTSMTIGNGANQTNITPGAVGGGPIAITTPSVPGRMPTFQQYALALVPATGPNGGGSVTFTTVNAPGLNFDALSGMTVSYRTHNGGVPVGELWITQTLTTVTVESSAALDNNTVQLIILRP